MNSAARPRKDTTRLKALATGLRLTTTAAPKITVSNAKIQNRNGDIGYWSREVVKVCSRFLSQRTPDHKNTSLRQYCSFLFVPLQHDTVNDTTNLEKFFLVMNHFRARVARNGIILA